MESGGPPRDWPESNCYADLWIELLHSLGMNAEAMFGFALAIDFEFDQWTFYKPKPGDIAQLYGIEIEELTIWKALSDHIVAQCAHGRVPLVEVDSCYLPDTEGRSYHDAHTKTTIAVLSVDPESEQLEYIHNRGRHTLDGVDYRALLRIDPPRQDADLDPFCEIAKLDNMVRRDESELRAIARELLAGYRQRMPKENPVQRHAAVMDQELQTLVDQGEDYFNLYAFANIRQCGSGFAFAADHLRWLGAGKKEWETAADCFSSISSAASMLILKMARIVHSGRIRDLTGSLEEMSLAWEQGVAALDHALER